MEELTKYRKTIDKIDAEITALLVERQMMARKIGELKKKQKAPIEDREREMAILHSRGEMAEAMGMDRKTVEEVWKLIMRAARQSQK